MKKILTTLMFATLSSISISQSEVNPLEVTGLVTSGVFDSEYGSYGNLLQGKNDIAVFKNSSTLGIIELDILGKSSPAWTGALDLNKMKGRLVTLDINGDGLQNDIAVIYDNGNFSISIKVWSYDFYSNTWLYTNAWTSPVGYDATKITNRVVAGDFDRDGSLDDIAAFYDYGNWNTKIHVFKFSGIYSLSYQWYYETSGYDANKITGRVVSGDFNRDNKYDDIAALYDYGNGVAKMHVFNSNGVSITQNNPFWSATGYYASMATGTLVSGNFDKSGITNHYNDDVVAFYDYGNGNVKAHVWTNTGSNTFSYSWKWQNTGFYVSEIRGRVFQMQNASDNGLKNFNISALYNYGPATNQYYKWANNFSNPWDFRSVLIPFGSKSLASIEESEESNDVIKSVLVYPIPAKNKLNINLGDLKISEINLYNFLGEKMEVLINEEKTILDISKLSSGVYFIDFISGSDKTRNKIIVQ